MMDVLIYAVFGVGILVVAAWLARQNLASGEVDTQPGDDLCQGLWDGRALNLAARVFDPADFLWLRDELLFPELAQAFAHSRKVMALRWLKALRRSFNQFVRTPEPAAARTGAGDELPSWQLLWLTLRFHLLLSYAEFIVRVFGPYHRLVPSLEWMRILSYFEARKERYGTANAGQGS